MPTTYNGIGTHYYGKKNLSVRRGQCKSCGRVVDLASYDTRLWFVVLFVPLIPVGRKRIMDHCPACTRHFATDQAQFTAIRQDVFDKFEQEFAANPTSEAAASMHGEMLFLHARDEARALRDKALSLFSSDAPLQATLGMQLEEFGDHATAGDLYRRAHALDPHLPVARDRVAREKIFDGRLDEARSLISFLEKPGAGQQYPLTTLNQLAYAYQAANRHEESLKLAEHLLREVPSLGQDRDFRNFVRKSEVALNRFDSILPPGSWLSIFNFKSPRYSAGQRWAFFLTAAATLFVGSAAALNEYYRRHRTVYVFNEFTGNVQVTIDGNAVSPGRQREVTLAEGNHQVSVTGDIHDEFPLAMQTSYWTRWTSDPAWVVNVGGASQIMFQTVHYSRIPRDPDTLVNAGERTFFAPHVDYAFKQPPNQLQVKNRDRQIDKTYLTVINEKPADIFRYALNAKPVDAAFTYAESSLLIEPTNSELLRDYTTAALAKSQLERAKSFLKLRLDVRPINVSWHRMYQELHTAAADRLTLIHDYDQLLKQDPANAQLLYLRGRLSPKRAESQALYERALAADPQFAWPWLALGYDAFTRGDWDRCKECLDKAVARHLNEDISAYLHTARVGLGEGPQLEREYRQKIAESPPQETSATAFLLAALLADRGDLRAAQQILTDWTLKFPDGERPTKQLEPYRGVLELIAGDFAAVEQRVRSGLNDGDVKLHWLLATNRPAEAAADITLAEPLTNQWNALSLSLAYDLAGNHAAADVWRAKACDALAKLDFEYVLAAEMLRADKPPMPADLDEVTLLPAEKSLLIAALAVHFREQHATLAPLAARLTIQPTSYLPLIKRAIAANN